MGTSNKEEKKFEDAKEFVLHNCYRDVCGQGQFESEVSPHAFCSYIKYPLFSPNTKDWNNDYKPYYTEKWGRKFCRFDEQKLNKLKCDSIMTRRQSKNRGLFFSKEDIKERVDSASKNLDLSGDIITSLSTPLKKILCLIDEDKWQDINENSEKWKEYVRFFKLQKYLQTNSWNDAIESISKNDGLLESFEKFSCVVGTIGNMMPIPEHTNPGGKDCDNYYYKFKYLYMDLFNTSTMDISQVQSIIRLYWFFYEDGHRYRQETESWKLFVEDFCLQDYFDNINYKKLIKPYKNMDDKDSAYPSKIKDWIDWFNCNTCLILKRGLRIFCRGKEPSEKWVNDIFDNVIEYSVSVNKLN